MTTTPEELVATWAALPVPTAHQQLEARPVGPSRHVWAAVDTEGDPHLLVEVDDSPEITLGETRGLQVLSGPHRIAGGEAAHYVDLRCVDAAALTTFAALAAQVVQAVHATATDRAGTVLRTVSEWRWFWEVDADQFSRHRMLGLFGELWFLHRWLSVSASSVSAWEGANRSRHDFQWPTSSVEVKTTSSSGARVHEVQSLEQLADPVTGQLFLFSLRVAADSIATNSVRTLVESATSALAGDVVARADFLQKVAESGYAPGAPAGDVTLRVVDERLYEVTAGFPRLTAESFAGGLPPGVTSVSYRLDLDACSPWLLSHSPGQWVP